MTICKSSYYKIKNKIMDLITQLNDLKRKVDFNTYDISVKELISMVSEGIIEIAPEYQRQFRWDEMRRDNRNWSNLFF
jgi:hypothetical protein